MNEIIDAHTHIAYKSLYPPFFLKEIMDGMIVTRSTKREKEIIKRIGMNVLSDYDGNNHIMEMNKANISKSVLLAADFFDEDDDEAFNFLSNYYIDIFKRHRDRYYLFLGINPNRKFNAHKKFCTNLKNNYVSGVKLYPPTGFKLDSNNLDYIYKICEEKGMPVLTHVGKSVQSMEEECNTYSTLINVMTRFPNLKIILGHAGILFIDEFLELALSNKNVFLEISGFQKIYKDKGLLYSTFEKAFRLIPNQIVFGSDWPMYNMNLSLAETIVFIKQVSKYYFYNENLIFNQNILNALERRR